jgi:glutathione synthase
MKLGIVVNDINSELAGYTTTHLALEAFRRGHEINYISLKDFSYAMDEQVHAIAHRPQLRRYRTANSFLRVIQSPDAIIERLSVDQLDVLLLRNDPSKEFFSRPWARLAAINFGRLAMRHGVLVLNDPDGLSHAINKIYLQVFPADVRPDAIITRNVDEILAFTMDHGGRAVIKPLQGSGGRNVFMLRLDEPENINQMIATVLEDGYALAQEYLPAISKGDTRMFMLNGRILEYKGVTGALRRIRVGGDIRANLTAGGKGTLAEITAQMKVIAQRVEAQLVRDGMFLVGLDIVGDKIIEINVFSPGALVGAVKATGVNFMAPIIDSLERKVEYIERQRGPGRLSNLELAKY